MELLKSFLGAALRDFQGIEGGGEKYIDEHKMGPLRARDMFGLARMLFEIFEPILEIRFHIKKSRFLASPENLRDLATRGPFSQDGSWLELRSGCFPSGGYEFCLPSTKSQLVLPASPLLGPTGI